MRRALLLLSLLSVPSILTSCKDDHTTAPNTETAAPNTETTAPNTETAAPNTETAAPNTETAAPDTSITTESPLDKICNLMKLLGRSEKEIKILRSGYEGDTVTLESLKDKEHIGIYCCGAAAAGNKELVLQCLDKGATDYNGGLRRAAEGGHMDIVQLMLSKGATAYNEGLWGAAEGGHMDIVRLMLSKGADPDAGLGGAAVTILPALPAPSPTK